MESPDLVFWLRLNADADRAYFLRGKSGLLFSAWVKLLMSVKVNAPKKGILKFTSINQLADELRILPDEAWALKEMIEGATQPDPDDDEDKAPALAIEGKTIRVVKWDKYQSAEAARKRKERARAQESSPQLPFRHGQTADVTDEPDTSRTNGVCHGQTEFVTPSCHVTETETERDYKSVVVVEGLSGETTTDHHEGKPFEPDAAVKAFVEAASAVKKFSGQAIEPEAFAQVLAEFRSQAPSGCDWVSCAAGFRLANQRKYGSGEKDPVICLRKWLLQEREDWVKKRNEIGGEKPWELREFGDGVARFLKGTDKRCDVNGVPL